MLIRPVLALLAGAWLALPVAATTSLVEQGRAVYNYRCYFCHGYSGDGNTLAATYLNPKPSNFKQASPELLDVAKIESVLHKGRPGTAMKAFSGIISDSEMTAVATFIVDEFVRRKADNTRYHTVENGWPEHERYRIAFPFAKGEIPLSRPWENLSASEVAGKRLYLASCISCHDRGAAGEDDITWESRPVSYPRNHFSLANPPKVDAMTSASPYALHDIPPKIVRMSRQERRGERLFQDNCAFCHGADGSGQNWIGKFMEPPPRDLRSPSFMRQATRETLAHAIREGLPNTSMPAWKSVLGDTEIRAIIAYINRAFHPVGQEAAAAK